MQSSELTFRLATDADVPALRKLVNVAYQELADIGLNFTGTYQDEAITRERMQGKEVLLAFMQTELVGTLSFSVRDQDDGHTVLYLGQFAVAPERKRQGIGRQLLYRAEERAKQLGLNRLRLDTAMPATHLVQLYKSHGYGIISQVKWEGKTYESLIMEKVLG